MNLLCSNLNSRKISNTFLLFFLKTEPHRNVRKGSQVRIPDEPSNVINQIKWLTFCVHPVDCKYKYTEQINGAQKGAYL